MDFDGGDYDRWLALAQKRRGGKIVSYVVSYTLLAVVIFVILSAMFTEKEDPCMHAPAYAASECGFDDIGIRP